MSRSCLGQLFQERSGEGSKPAPSGTARVAKVAVQAEKQLGRAGESAQQTEAR